MMRNNSQKSVGPHQTRPRVVTKRSVSKSVVNIQLTFGDPLTSTPNPMQFLITPRAYPEAVESNRSWITDISEPHPLSGTWRSRRYTNFISYCEMSLKKLTLCEKEKLWYEKKKKNNKSFVITESKKFNGFNKGMLTCSIGFHASLRIDRRDSATVLLREVNPSTISLSVRRLPFFSASQLRRYPEMSIPHQNTIAKPQDHTLCFIDGMSDSMMCRSAFEDSYYEEDGINGNTRVKQRKGKGPKDLRNKEDFVYLKNHGNLKKLKEIFISRKYQTPVVVCGKK
ncbi:hypothetical protein DICVIV_08802 [Dictyocaulus viviparus]|uniref:Uncharacterized protein n=1 Tax=Dictyocaulus viviparus TaxID=29172 RepID=A0A0D8XKW2_DICVI|nr:hypothetical protein DICVIV_08802 [Dictyocaulus viviparus]